jgi:hypothetical protein
MAYQKIGDTSNVTIPTTPRSPSSDPLWLRAVPYAVAAVGLYWFLGQTARQMTPPRPSRRYAR